MDTDSPCTPISTTTNAHDSERVVFPTKLELPSDTGFSAHPHAHTDTDQGHEQGDAPQRAGFRSQLLEPHAGGLPDVPYPAVSKGHSVCCIAAKPPLTYA